MKRWVGRALGPGLFVLTLVTPPPAGMEVEAWRVAGVGLLMAVWWVTEVVPIPVTALLPLVLLPLLEVSSIGDAASPFANPIIFLFMGGFMIAQAMQKWDLHRRIAFAIIEVTGTGPTRLIAGFMTAAAFLSMWVSNTAVAVMMLPIGLSVIEVLAGTNEPDEHGPADTPGSANEPAPARAPAGLPVPGHRPDPFAVALLLGIAYGCSIGGVATLIGTPPNALLAGFLSEELGIRVGFAQWMVVGVPMTLVLLPLTWWLLTRVIFRVDPAGPALPPGLLEGVRAGLGPISAGERRVALLFTATALAWMTRPLLEEWIPGLTDAGIAIGAAVLLFILPAGRDRPRGRLPEGEAAGGTGEASPAVPGVGEGLLDWAWARRIPWGILLLFGGGLSLAGAITRSGLAVWIGEALQGAGALPLLVLLLIVAAVIVFLTELTSNTATAAAFIPILAGLAVAVQIDPVVLTITAALAASCAFMLPVATPPNAVVFGSGRIRMGEMVRAGVVLNMVVILVVPLLVLVFAQIAFG